MSASPGLMPSDTRQRPFGPHGRGNFPDDGRTGICSAGCGPVLRLSVLGPLVVRGDDGQIPLPGARRRAVVVRLIVAAGHVVGSERLAFDVWDGHPPKGASSTLHSHVSFVRGALGADRIVHVDGGYRLETRDVEIDHHQFETEIKDGLAALMNDDPGEAEELFSRALNRWRGPALADVNDAAWAMSEITRLEELRLSAVEGRLEALLALGRDAEVVPAVEAAIGEHPLREHLWGQLMTALYRSGRQADALRAYQRVRDILGEELGLEPSSELVALESAIATHDPTLSWTPAGADPGGDRDPAAARVSGLPVGTVTFLFTDVVGSTSAWERDPAAMGVAMARHDVIVEEAVVASEGTVVKPRGEGDSRFAVFGRASDAVGAALAVVRGLDAEAWPMSDPLRVRVALHTGETEVRAGDYYGTTVNRCARLRSIAHPGQVLCSQAAAQLARDALPPDADLVDLGSHRLKDLARPEQVYGLVHPDIDCVFPPLVSLDSHRHNLPVQPSSFIGRQAELAELSALMGSSRLVTLTGAGGSGKTRLALQVAAELVDCTDDGVWFVDLAPLGDPDLVCRSVAVAVGVREEPGRPLADTLVDALRQRRLLLFLDNCEHLVDPCAKLVDALLRHGVGLHVLATSREPLGIGGEQVFRVPPLSLPPAEAKLDRHTAVGFEAVQLFVDRARSHDPAFVLDDDNVVSVISVCGRLDGIPLAIELAAARLRSLSVADIEARLGDRFRLLTGGSRTALGRQHTLRALVDWSYELLNYRDRAVLERLSVFAGGFDLEAAESVCASSEVERFEVLDTVGSLVDKSLVQADHSGRAVRYRLLETIRQYATEKLGEQADQGTSARDAHAWVCLELAKTAAGGLFGPHQADWLQRLDLEHDNLRAAAAHLLATPDRTADVLRLGVALREYWDRRGYFSEGLDLLQEALGRCDPKDRTVLRASALAAAAQLSLYRAESDTARSLVEEGLGIARQVNDPAIEADLLDINAWTAFQTGDYDVASSLLDEAVDLARRADAGRLVARALAHRAGVKGSVDLEGARADIAEALDLVRAGDPERVVSCLNILGCIELIGGNLEAGRAHLEEGRAIARDFSSLQLMVITHNLGLAAIMQSDIARAVDLTVDSLRLIQQQLGDVPEIPYILLGAALCLSAAGALDLAAEVHGVADAILESMSQVFEPLEARLRHLDHSRLRHDLGEAVFETAYQAGRRLTFPEAAQLAQQQLEGSVSTPTPDV